MLFVNGKELQESRVSKTRNLNHGIHRESICITLNNVTYDELTSTFVNDVSIVRETNDYDGNKVTEDYSAYSIASNIVDRRNGVFDVYMCKKTDKELYAENIRRLEEENARLLFENLTGEDY